MTRNLKRGVRFAVVTLAVGVASAWVFPQAVLPNVAIFLTVFICGYSVAATSYILIDTLRRERTL